MDLDVERVVYHAERPGFRVTEIEMTPAQQVPWHSHTNVEDSFYVLDGAIRIALREPDDTIDLREGQTWGPVDARRPHLVTNPGDSLATFLVLQRGDYDFIPFSN